MIYPEKVPYLTLYTQRVMLSPGSPVGYGNLVYLFSPSIEDSIKMINRTYSFYHTSAYKYYFYPMKYFGKIRSKTYRINDRERREEVYAKIARNTDLTPRRYVDLKANGNRNVFFELSRYFEIFYNMVGSLPPREKINLFWIYLKKILDDPFASEYASRILLIDGEMYGNNFAAPLKDKLTNPVFLLYYTMLKYPNMLVGFDIDIFIYCGTRCIKLNPAKIVGAGDTQGDATVGVGQSKEGAVKYRQLLMRLIPAKVSDIMHATDADVISKEENREEIASTVAGKFNFIGDVEDITTGTNTIPEEDVIRDEIETKSSDALDDVVSDIEDDPAGTEAGIPDKIDAALSSDDSLKLKIDAAILPAITPKSKASTARDAKIRKEQEMISVGNSTIGDLQKKSVTRIPISRREVGSSIQTTNKNMGTVSFANFDREYNEKVFPTDMVNVITDLNNKSIPMTVIKYDIKDTSDELNYKDTYTIVLEDAYRQRHTITVDIPKFIDGRYMWIGGSKKLILAQDFLLPVVKSGPNKVQIVTNTNKMFIERVGSNSISSIERVNKLIASSEAAAKYFVPGYVAKLNESYITTVEYDEFSKKFSRFQCGTTTIYFNQEEALDAATKHGIYPAEDDIFIGFKDRRPLFVNQNTQKTENGKTIIDIIADAFPEDVLREFVKIKSPKRLMYSEATTMEQPIALCMLLGFWKGLSYMLESMRLKYRLEEGSRHTLASNEEMVEFKDCAMIYEDDVATSLIMNGFRKINTKEWDLAEFDTKDPYMPYLIKVYGKANIAHAIMTNYEFNIDPITREILEDMHLPTEMVKLCIYANSLLADSQFTPDYNQKLSRVRTNEIVPCILYDAIAKQYAKFRSSNGKTKLTIPRNIVIKNLLALKTVEDNSTLNPALELERKHTILYKGWRGVNSDHTYTQDKRVYDDSMIGIIGQTTSPDGAVGVQKVLTMEPNISSLRGHTIVPDDKSKLKDVNLASPAELLCPMAVTTDDPTRTGHMVKQAKHMLPVKNSSPVLISNGAEEFARFDLSSTFVINAKDNGKIVDYREDLGLLVCEYKDGSHQAINLNPTIEKNGGGGFYLSNRLSTNLKVGDKFKKNDMLAWHKDFFHSDPYCGNRINAGTLTKVALMSTYNTYQDSTVITEDLSERMATEMVFPKQIVIGKNANLEFLIEEGAEIEVGDTIARFDTSFEDNELNQLLNSLSDDLKEGVLEGSRNDVRSKYAGKVESIRIYSTVDVDELSPSLKKVVTAYYKKVAEKRDFLGKYDSSNPVFRCGVLLDEADGKVSPNRFGVIKGQNVEDSVLIEIYIKHEEYLETASKCTYFAGLKCTVGEVIPRGFEPWSEHRPDEEVGSLIASNSILKRMTPSIMLTTLGNKCIVELKYSLRSIYDKNRSDPVRMKSEMTSLIYKFFAAMDKSGTNTKKYKEKFEPMDPNAFRRWFKGFFENPDAYLVLDIVEYERSVTKDDIERAAKVINIPLYEYVYLPHLTMDKTKVVRSREKVPVGYIHMKRPQQTVAKKNGISISADIRSSLTNQATGADKNGRQSDLENTMLVANGMTSCLRELNGPRADDMVMKTEMLTQIATQGYARYEDLTNEAANKTTLNTVDVFFMGMGLKTDLVTKGLMLKSTIKKDL